MRQTNTPSIPYLPFENNYQVAKSFLPSKQMKPSKYQNANQHDRNADTAHRSIPVPPGKFRHKFKIHAVPPCN
jgi:hypothetical protein